MKVTQCDQQIEQALARLPDRSAGAKLQPKELKRGRKPNNLRFDGTQLVFRALGVDLTAIEGIEVPTALVILGEIGADVSKFPTEKHFTSWLGLCPNHHQSNHTLKSRRVRKGKNRLAIALRLAARSLHRSHSALGAFFRRMNSRLGYKGAITATAHKLARYVYAMLKYGQAYVRPYGGADRGCLSPARGPVGDPCQVADPLHQKSSRSGDTDHVGLRLAKPDHASVAHGPGCRWVDDPDPRVPRAVQHLPGDPRPGRRHARHDAGAAGPAREFAEPGLQRPPRGHGQEPSRNPGRSSRRARGLENCSTHRRQGRPGGRRNRSLGPTSRIGDKQSSPRWS